MARKRRYGFVKPQLVTLFTVVDGLGYFVAALIRAIRPAKLPGDPRRILLVNFAHIGDLLLVTPALRGLREAHPRAHISVLAGPWSKEVLAACPYLDELMVFRPSWWDRDNGAYLRLSELADLVRLLRGGRFDLSINFKSFFQENLALWLARIPARVGHGIYGGGFFLTHRLEHDWNAHTVEKNLALVSHLRVASAVYEAAASCETGRSVRLLWNPSCRTSGEPKTSLPAEASTSRDGEAKAGVSTSHAEGLDVVQGRTAGALAFGPSEKGPRPEMFVFAEDVQAACEFLRETLGGREASPLIAFHIGAGYPSKRWGEEKYAALADALATTWGARVVVVGSPDDVALVDRMQALCQTELVIAAGKLSIRQMAALLSYCRLFVGNDSAPAHIAAALGLPAVAIFSGENEAHVWRPYANNCQVVQRRPDCYPCGRRICDRDHKCMADITVAEVLAAVERILGETRSSQ
ncbi:MAG: glycosyltransferase family 9 protein [Chloroflexi bacterium]|nr:glycosyltransferase family 9 protein [Chloroflexota bacterium]